MSDLRHWHGTPSQLVQPPDCCKAAAEKHERDAVHEEARRIVIGGIGRIDAYETAIMTVVNDEASRELIQTVVRQCREALAAVGCICPRVDITRFGDSAPQWLPGRSELCGVHGQGMRRS